MGRFPCCMLNLRNDSVNCHYFSNFHLDFKMLSCRMVNLRNGLCHVNKFFLVLIGSVFYVTHHHQMRHKSHTKVQSKWQNKEK